MSLSAAGIMACFITFVGIILLIIYDDLCIDYETKHKKNVMISGITLLTIGLVALSVVGYMAFSSNKTQRLNTRPANIYQ